MPLLCFAAVVYWLSGGILFFTFIGYSLCMKALARWRDRPLSSPQRDAPLPSVRIILSAHNVEDEIVTRLENLLQSHYPAEKLRVLLVSDGSTDATVARVEALNEPRIEVIALPTSSGKANALNLAFERCSEEIVVLTDARQQFTPDAIAQLARHFSDPAIGAVSGALEISPSTSTTGAGVDAYWRYEKALRADESRYDSCIGCTGAIYAVRRRSFQPIPADTILDDVVIPMQIALQGQRVIHDTSILAFDPQPLDPRSEQRRKQRTLAGNFQMLFRHPKWLYPTRSRLWFQLIAHKYLRLTAPIWLIACLLTSALLSSHPFYAACFAAQIALYLLAIIGLVVQRGRFFTLPAAFLFLNIMTLRGGWHYLAGTYRRGWK